MKTFVKCSILICLIVVMCVLGVNFYVIHDTREQIVDEDVYSNFTDVDAIIVLGAGVRNGEPSPMLRDRLLKGIELYHKGVAPKLIMSGDHGQSNYDEVNTMKSYAIDKEVPSSDIFMDHAGFSTYDSIYRAKEIFKAKKVIIVTQKYHLYRALYIANQIGLEAYGVETDEKEYFGQFKREVREVLARDKDVLKCIFKPESTYLGRSISVSGDGDETNDKDVFGY